MTIAVWCVFASFILIYLPRGMTIRGAVRQDGGYDVHHPRAQEARLEGKPARAQAAHHNMIEGFAPFLGGVWVAHAFGADAALRDGLALAYVAARLVYIVAYVGDWGYGRTAIWFIGWFATLGLYLAPVMG